MKTEKLALIVAAAKLPPLVPEVKHLWADGLCMRTMAHPAGTVVVGAEYKKSHIFYLVSGRILVDIEGEALELTGGDMFVAKPGTQKAAYALEDSTVACFYGTQSTNIVDLVAEFTTTEHRFLAGQPDNPLYIAQLKAELLEQ